MKKQKQQNHQRNHTAKQHIKNTNTNPVSNREALWLCGKHPSFSILQLKRRKIFEILVTKNTALELENFLSKHSLTHLTSLVKLVEGKKIESTIGENQLHQGIAINCSRLPVKNQFDLLQELEALDGENLPTLLLLDQLSDPQNIGAIIRSAVSFGVKKIIFSEHNAPKENATIVKSSAGTIDLADLVIVTNFNNLIEKLKKLNYWCIGLDGYATTKINDVKGYKNIALIIGSEGNGMRDLVKKNCDILAKIDIDGKVESLNASVAAAIALYHLKMLSHF